MNGYRRIMPAFGTHHHLLVHPSHAAMHRLVLLNELSWNDERALCNYRAPGFSREACL
jgi:hypothetical protein